jgi:hypothetical protein
MKNQILTTIIVFVALFQFSTFKANGQFKKSYIPDNGYWVLVSNIHVKKVTTVQFYNLEHQLIYEEVIKDQKMDLKRVKTLRCLKKGLETALLAWNQQKKAIYNKDWVAMNFKN